jgi:hypothetical protein
MCLEGYRLRESVAGEGPGIWIVAQVVELFAGGGKRTERTLRPVSQRLILKAGNQLALIVLDFEDQGIGVVWAISLDAAQDERQGIPFGLERGDQIRGTSIPKRVHHIALATARPARCPNQRPIVWWDAEGDRIGSTKPQPEHNFVPLWADTRSWLHQSLP